MKTMAAILLAATTTTSPINAPQRAISTSTTVPAILHFDTHIVDRDALSLRIMANTQSLCFLRVKGENLLDETLPVLVHVGGAKPVLIDKDSLETPIMENKPTNRDFRIKIVMKVGRRANIDNYDIRNYDVICKASDY